MPEVEGHRSTPGDVEDVLADLTVRRWVAAQAQEPHLETELDAAHLVPDVDRECGVPEILGVVTRLPVGLVRPTFHRTTG